MLLKQKTQNVVVLLHAAWLLFSVPVYGSVYVMHDAEDSVIGELKRTHSQLKDTLLDIARQNSLGYHEIKLANPELDTWIPGQDVEVILPTEYVLPQAPRTGIVLNIPEMRLYYFPEKKQGEDALVITYPLGIGREGWSTPYIQTRIIQKKKNPYWFPPDSIRAEHDQNGDPLPERVGPGPDNPLGDYALRLGLPDYLIHGTNKPFGIGMRVSHGCIRLYPEDIETLYSKVKIGTRVNIVNQPYKVGQRGDKIFLEAHPFLEEDTELFEDNLTSVVKMLVRITADQAYEIDWDLAKQVIRERHGIPVEIGTFLPGSIYAASGTNDDAITPAQTLELRLETELPQQHH